jgi:hypothetical protein
MFIPSQRLLSQLARRLLTSNDDSTNSKAMGDRTGLSGEIAQSGGAIHERQIEGLARR